MRLLALLVIVGCSSPPHAAAVPPSPPPPRPAPPIDAAVAVVEPDAAEEEPAAAVVEPEAPPPLEDVDTTIDAKDLPDVAGFAKHERIKSSGGQLLALFVRDRKLSLSIVVNENGIVRSFALGLIDSKPNNEFDSEAYMPRSRVAEYQGPIQFAIRVRRPKVAEQQLVVYAAGPSVAVVTRPLAGGAWSKVLRLDFNKDATFVAIGTTDPH